MDRLANTLELLDGPLDDRRAVSANLRDLRRINRVMGGVDLSWRALAALVGDGARPVGPATASRSRSSTSGPAGWTFRSP